MSYNKNTSDKAGIVSTGAKSRAYSDLNLKLTLHPIRKDIVPLKDDAAVTNAIKNLVLSNYYERPFSPALGSNLRALLFEPADVITRSSIKEAIEAVIQENEPRVSRVNVIVDDMQNKNSYRVTIVFNIKQINIEQSVEIVLKRLR
jgi:phage baseplate assembly protein W